MAVLLHLLFLWIFGAVPSCYSDEDSCPGGAPIDQESLNCYWIPASASAWLEARDVCQQIKGGDIAMVDKPRVQNFIDSSFQSEVPALVWLRKKRNDSGLGSFISQHGDAVKETCSHMVLGLGKWGNSPCNQKHRFICEKEISVRLPSLDSYVVGVPVMSRTYTQSWLQPLPSPPDLGKQRVEMMLFPGLWFSHGGQVLSVDLVSQPSQQLTLAKVQILRPYCRPNHHLVPPGCRSLLNPFSCCSTEPLCNTTGVCVSGYYWCHLLESCLYVTSPCSPYHPSAGDHAFSLPPRYHALPPFYHMVADVSLKIIPASEPVHFRVTLPEKVIPIYPDDIIAVQHTRKAGEFLHCVSSSDSAWQQSYLSLPGPEIGGWVEVGVSAPTNGGQWVDNVVCDLRLIYEDFMHLYDVPPVLSSTQSDLRIHPTTTIPTIQPQTSVSGLHVLFPVLGKDNQIHLPINNQIIIIVKILSGQNATSTWSAPVSKKGVPFQLSCPPDIPEIQAVCERDAPDVWFSYAYAVLPTEGEKILNITASNMLNSQRLSVKLHALVPVTGLSIQPKGFYRVLVDIPQKFTAAVASGSSVKYTWITDNLVQSAYTGEAYNVVFKKPGEYKLRVTAENPVSSQFLDVKLKADVMAPLADLTLLSNMEAVAVNSSIIYTLRVKVDVSIGVTISWDFGDSSACVNHTVSAPLERSGTLLNETAVQIYLQDASHHIYSTPGDYTLRIQVENKYDHITKAVPIKVRSPLNRVLVSSVPAVPNINQTTLFEASPFPSSYGILYTWNFGDSSLELKGPHSKVRYAFKAAGVYNVSVHSSNTLSQMISWMAVEVVETISGIHLSYNGPNELNSVTKISGRVSTGSSLRWTFELGDGSVFKDLSKSSISYIYKSVGNYTAQVTASNAVSSVRQSISVEIFQLSISGILPSTCIESGREVTFQAVVPGNVSLLSFYWSFGDGSPHSVNIGTTTIAHLFSSPGIYLVDLTVSSQVGSADFQTNVCVEALITDLTLLSAKNAVAVGEQICFEASVLPSVESYRFLWNDSFSSDSPISGESHHCFVFSKEGRGEVMVVAHNQVSQKTAKATLFVERPVLKFSIKHEGKPDALIINQSYRFWTEPRQNNGVFEWNFGDGSPKTEGQNQLHAFTSAGRFQVTASVSNVVSQEFVDTYLDVQVPISSIIIHTDQPYAEVGQEVMFTAVSNVMENVTFYWTVDPLFPSKLGTSQYSQVFPGAGIFEVKVVVQNLVSKMEASKSINVVERIQGVQITSQSLKSMRYFPTNETITLTVSVMHGSNLTYHWLAHQDRHNGTVGDSECFKLFTHSPGDVSVKLAVANALGTVHKDVTLRALERVSGVNISTPGDVMAMGKTVNISVSVKTGTGLQYSWCLESDCSPVATDVPFVLHVFKAIGSFKLKVSVANVLGSVDVSKQITVQEHISEIDFKVDGKSHPFFVTSNSLLQFHGSVRKGNVLYWTWIVAYQERKVIVLGNNQTISTSFMDVGDHHVKLNASNNISWQSISHIITVEDAIQGLHLRVSKTVICENEAITFTPSITQGSDVSVILEFAGRNYSFNILEELKISALPVGNHIVKAIIKNHVSSSSATVAVQVVGQIKGLHLVDCCSPVLEASKPFLFKASITTGSQVTYQWSFQLNHFRAMQKTGQSVLYSPFSNGSLSVTVEANSETFCSKSITETVTVQWPVKKVNLVGTPGGPFIGYPVTFFALPEKGSDLTFQWDFGDAKDKVKMSKFNMADHKYKTEGRFVVQVTVFNNVSQVSAQLPVVVRKLECAKPEVFLIQEQSQILKSMPNYFEASVELNGCISYNTAYLWEVFQEPNCTEKKVSLNSSVDVTTPLLSLSKHTLEVGEYCLKFTTKFQETPLQDHKTTRISVRYSPLVSIIGGGSYRMWSSHNDLILDGNQSYDPDSTEQPDKHLQFQWDIIVQQNSTASPFESFFHDHSTQLNGSTLILPRQILEPGRRYQITLTVQKHGRTSVSTMQYVKVCDAEVLPVTVKCVSCSLLSSSYVSHSQPVALTGYCSLCNGPVQFKWSAKNPAGKHLHLNEVTTSTGDSSRNLVIRPNILTWKSEYIITLNVSQSTTGLWGLASITLKLNHPPQGGSCILSPEDSVQLLQNMVSFNCSGWKDEDSSSAQMMYSLQVAQCESPGPLCPLITLYRGTQQTFRTPVPLGSVGSKDKSSNITVQVQVEDNMGAKVTALRRNLMVVLPMDSQGSTEWLKKRSQSELSALLQQGNPQDVIPYSTAFISQLNQLEAISAQEFEDRVQMRGKVTQALASLPVSSLQDAAQLSSALAHSTAVPSELQCEDCHTRVLEAVKKMIKVIREQTKQGDVTPVDTGRNILNVLSSSMTAAPKSKASFNVNYHYKHQDPPETVMSALQQVGELMRSLMWSRLAGEEYVSLEASQIKAVGIRGDPASNLLCTVPSSHCHFHIPSPMAEQLKKQQEDVLQVLLVMETEGNPFASAADPPISTSLAAMEFATPQGLPITIANLTTDSAIHVTLHKKDKEDLPMDNITLPSKGSVNFTVRAVETDPHAGLFIALNFSLIQGTGRISSGQVNISVSDQQDLPLSQHSLVRQLSLSLSTDIPSLEESVFLTPLLNGSSKDLYVTLSSLSSAEVCVSVCVFSSLCQFFSMEQMRWSTEGVRVLSSSRPTTTHCLTQHLTLFGASLFVHPDAILLLPPSDGPVRNVVAWIVCGALVVIHLLLGLIAHKLDHLESLRLSCIPLCGQAGRYHYRVLVKTGWQRGAGTSAHVGISLCGLNKSGSRHLRREGAFHRNGLDEFHIETDANLGEIWKICIWHDNTGLDPSWYLQHVIVWDMQMDNMFFFLVEDWLSVENEKNAGMVQKVVLATCPQELQQFGRMLRAQLLFGLREHHLWLSLWERPAHSSFGRTQRVTSCALLLHLYLAAGAVWYGAVSTKSSSGPVANQMLMTPETVLVGMTVAAVMFPLQSLLTFLFRKTKSKLAMELSHPPYPMPETVEMDVYISHPELSCSSFLSIPVGPESSTHEGFSSFNESSGSLKLESEFWGTSKVGNESSVDQWPSNDSIFGLPELTGPARLLKRKRALLQLRLASPTSDLPNLEANSSPDLREQPPSLSEEEQKSVSANPFQSSSDSSGPATSDSGRYSPNETILSESQDRSFSEWSELSGDKPVYEGRLYKSPSSLSVGSVASTFLPSLPPDSCSTTSNTRIGVPRGKSCVMLPTWVLAVVYLLVALLLGICLAIVGLYGSKFSSSVVLMWLISALSAFLTSALLLEPLKICVRALYLAFVVKPVDPEVEDRLAQETIVRRLEEQQGVKVHPPCGYGLLQAKEEARKVRMLRNLMRDCLVYMLFLLVVLMVNYQENIQEMNSRRLHSAMKRSIDSASPGQPNLTVLTGWMEVWQWMDHSLTSHLHQNPFFSLVGPARIRKVQSEKSHEGNAEEVHTEGYEQSSVMFTASALSHSTSLIKTKPRSNISDSWSWTKSQTCMFRETEEILLGNNSVSTGHILSVLRTAQWVTAETQAVLVEFTQHHRETGVFMPVSILLENTQTHRILSTISVQSFHMPGSYSGMDLNMALMALLLFLSVCILSAELWAVLRQGVQYLRQCWHVQQVLLALLSLATASLRLCFLSKATARLSSHLSQPDAFTDFHSAALLSKRSSQLSAVLLTVLILQTAGALRFVRRWVVFGRVLQQACAEMCGVALLCSLLLLLFSHTGLMLFSGSVEGFKTMWKTTQSLLGLFRGRMVLHQLCEQHPVLGPLFCMSAIGMGLWLLGRLGGAILVHTYRTFQAEMYRPCMEPQDYEMVEFLIKRLKLWMGLSKAKEFRHRVKFEGLESPPSRFSQCSQFSGLSVPSSPSSPTGSRLISSTSSLASECSTLSDSPDLQQYLDRLLTSVDSLLASFDRVNQLTEDVLNIEQQLQKAQDRKAEKREKHDKQDIKLCPQTYHDLSKGPPPDQPPLCTGLKPLPSSHQSMPQVIPHRRGTHSESSILGHINHHAVHPGKQVWQLDQDAEPDIRSFSRRRAWHSGSCHSADPIQRSPKSQNPESIPVRPHSEEGDRSEVSKDMPVKRRAWHPEDSEMEKDQDCFVFSADRKPSSIY